MAVTLSKESIGAEAKYPGKAKCEAIRKSVWHVVWERVCVPVLGSNGSTGLLGLPATGHDLTSLNTGLIANQTFVDAEDTYFEYRTSRYYLTV